MKLMKNIFIILTIMFLLPYSICVAEDPDPECTKVFSSSNTLLVDSFNPDKLSAIFSEYDLYQRLSKALDLKGSSFFETSFWSTPSEVTTNPPSIIELSIVQSGLPILTLGKNILPFINQKKYPSLYKILFKAFRKKPLFKEDLFDFVYEIIRHYINLNNLDDKKDFNFYSFTKEFIHQEQKASVSIHKNVIKFLAYFTHLQDDFINAVSEFCILYTSRLKTVKVPAVLTSSHTASIVLPNTFTLNEFPIITYKNTPLAIKDFNKFNNHLVIRLTSSFSLTPKDKQTDTDSISKSIDKEKLIDFLSLKKMPSSSISDSDFLTAVYPPIEAITQISLQRYSLQEIGIDNLEDIYLSIINRLSPYGQIAQQLRKMYKAHKYRKSYHGFLPSSWKKTLKIFQKILMEDPLNLKSNPYKYTSTNEWHNWVLRSFIPHPIREYVNELTVLLHLKNSKFALSSLIKGLSWVYFIDPQIEKEMTNCSGIIVSSNTLLTAAHCLKNADSHSYLSITKNQTSIKSEAIYIHPKYSRIDDDQLLEKGEPSYDIGIVRFPEGTFLPHEIIQVSPLPLNTSVASSVIITGTKASASTKFIAIVPLVDKNSFLLKHHKSRLQKGIFSKQGLATFFQYESIHYDDVIRTQKNMFLGELSYGDSGGALINQQNQVVGINSQTSQGMSLHSSIFFNLDFIKKILSQDPKLKISGINY